MKKLTIKDLIASSGIPPQLVRSVIRQQGGWDYFKDCAENICNHGAYGGFVGFTYYSDTVKFAQSNKKNILQKLTDDAEEFGEPLFDMLASFKGMCGLRPDEIAEAIYNPRSEEKTTVFNCLAWWALEEVARAYCDTLEDNQESGE